jgi:hypothetical protein
MAGTATRTERGPAHDRTTWSTANQRYLCAAIEVTRAHLLVRRAQVRGEDATPATQRAVEAEQALQEAGHAMPAPAALEAIAHTFRLSAFERHLLMLCAAVEFDGAFPALCALLHDDQQKSYPTFGLALAALPGAHWSALAAQSPLRRWHLLEVGAGHSLTLSPLRLDETMLHALAGVRELDDRLGGLVMPVSPESTLSATQRQITERVVHAWAPSRSQPDMPVVYLCGDDFSGHRAIAAAACAALGRSLYSTQVAALPTALSELRVLLRLWEREALLSRSAWLLEFDVEDEGERAQRSVLFWLLEHTQIPVLVAGRERPRRWHRPVVAFDVPRATVGDQRTLWQQALGPAADALSDDLEALVMQFQLNAPAILAAAAEAGTATVAEGSDALANALWDACRVQARPRLDDMAQRIEPVSTWEDLVLPEQQRAVLAEIAIHVRQRATVYNRWGFAAKSARGLGISALFVGPSGTGKTTAAEVLANELRLDVYRIDLSAVVSKYIGETEKNLRRVFDAADEGGAILLFDEADALFGKRSEVKDSHDRYANIEVGYLLQRMEAYRGLAILTTNLKNALDSAFLRRIRFVVSFPFPDVAQRAEIWRRVFPPAAPKDGLDIGKLSRLSIPGGNIRNIALHAAFLAAEDGEPIRMTHLQRAARTEYAKMEKTLTAAETEGWL